MNKDQPVSMRPSVAALLAAALALTLLSGCATYGHRMDQWVGQRYSDFLRFTGHQPAPPVAPADSSGNSVYLVDAVQGSDCAVSVTVDRVGFIQDWNSQGSSCR